MFWFQTKMLYRMEVARWQTFGLRGLLFRRSGRMPVAIPKIVACCRPLAMLDYLFFPEFLKVEVRKPLFIMGHPRSGTTFLHRMLTETNEFCVFRFWEILYVPLLARKLFGKSIQRQISRGEGVLFPKESGHEIGLDQVEEEELLFLHNLNTQFAVIYSPLAFSDWDFTELVFGDRQPEWMRRRSMALLKKCFQRQIYSTGRTQIVAKMPYSTLRLRSLLETFPDARIVYIIRSPLETIPSHLTLHRSQFEYLWGLDRIPRDRLERYFDRRYRHNVEFYRYVEDLIASGAVPSSQLMVLPYPDMQNDLAGVIDRVAAFSGLSLSAELKERIRQQSQKQKTYRAQHQNLALEEFGLTKERIVKDLGFVFDKYGFDTQGVVRS